MIRQILCILLVTMPFWLKDCLGIEEEIQRQPVAEVLGQVLYLDEVEAVIPEDCTPDDSVQVAQDYVCQWIKEALLYDAASKNLMESEEIRTMVENYRRQLMVYEYQQQALVEKMEETVTDDDITAYYEQNKQRFPLSQSLIKGMYVRVPAKASYLTQVKDLFKKTDDATVDAIESLCLQKGLLYSNFTQEWMTMDLMMEQIPHDDNKNWAALLRTQKVLVSTDANFCYLLGIHQYLLPGQPEPLEYVSGRIRSILQNHNKTRFLHEMEDNMYEQALEKGLITFYETAKENPTDNE